METYILLEFLIPDMNELKKKFTDVYFFFMILVSLVIVLIAKGVVNITGDWYQKKKNNSKNPGQDSS